MRHLKPVTAAAAIPAAILFLAVLPGCGGFGGSDGGTPAGVSCIDDSPHCIGQRQSALRQLVSDPGRGWITQPATPEAYASGVRLFAFKSRKRELTCGELALGRREADGAAGALKGPGGAKFTSTQVARAMLLAREVSAELAAEHRRRCSRHG